MSATFAERLRAWWKRPPKDFEGGLLANYMGYEVFVFCGAMRGFTSGPNKRSLTTRPRVR